MNSISKNSFKLFQTLVAIIMIAGLLFPPSTVAKAQDPVPPSTGEAAPEAPVVEQTAEPPADPATSFELPPVQTVEAPTEAAAVVVFPLEQTVEIPTGAVPVETFPLAQTVEVPADAVLPATTGDSPEEGSVEEPDPAETLVEIVELLDQTNTVLIDENNNEIPLSSTEAVEALETADPFFWDSTHSQYVGYTYTDTSCPSFVTVCNHVESPLTSALADENLPDNGTLYIEGGRTYAEDVIIDTGLNLQGGTGFHLEQDWLGNWYVDHSSGDVANIQSLTLRADLGSSNHVTATNIFVDGSSVGSDTTRGNMLQDAVELVATGTAGNNSMVVLSAGTFQQEYTLLDTDDFEINKDYVTLEGTGDTTVIRGYNSIIGGDQRNEGLKVTGNNVNVRKLKVVNSNHGIEVNGDNTTLTNLTLTSNNYGVFANSDASGLHVHNSNIRGNDVYGLYNHGDNLVDATGNYWGSPNGPTNCWKNAWGLIECGSIKGDKVYANQNYSYDVISTCHAHPWWNWHCHSETRTNPLDVLTGSHLGAVVCNDNDPATIDTLNGTTCTYTPASCSFTNQERDPFTGECGYTDTCLTGQSRNSSNGQCEYTTTCLPGQARDISTGNCNYTTACLVGQVRDLTTGNCDYITTCLPGQSRNLSTGLCEYTTTCLTGQARDVLTGNCNYTTTCLAGQERNLTTGLCDYTTTCLTGQTRNTATGLCDYTTTCLTGQTRNTTTGLCDYTTTCLPGQIRDVSTGNCNYTTTCLPGQARDVTDGSCDYTSTCIAGQTRNISTGACVTTICNAGFNDMNSDGTCETSGCSAGASDINNDGTCEWTICTGGTFDSNSDGLCEEREPGDPIEKPFGPLGFLFGAGGAGVGRLIPVTGGMNQLSCTEANTLVLPNGDKVVFSDAMCGFQAELTEEKADVLPAPLPEGLSYGSGMTLSLQKDATPFTVLPSPVTNTLSFVIPEEMKDKTFVILYWDPTLKGGLGDWVEIPAKIVENGVVKSQPLFDGDPRQIVSGVEVTVLLTSEATLNFTGTFVLAAR